MNGDTIDVGRLRREVRGKYSDAALHPSWPGSARPLDFDAVLGDIAMKVDRAIEAQGRF